MELSNFGVLQWLGVAWLLSIVSVMRVAGFLIVN